MNPGELTLSGQGKLEIQPEYIVSSPKVSVCTIMSMLIHCRSPLALSYMQEVFNAPLDFKDWLVLCLPPQQHSAEECSGFASLGLSMMVCF